MVKNIKIRFNVFFYNLLLIKYEEIFGYFRSAVKEYFGDNPKTSPDYGRIVNKAHWNRLMKLMDSGKIVIGGDADEDERYIGKIKYVSILLNINA